MGKKKIKKIRLNDWVVEWLKLYKRIMIKPSTYDSYLQYAKHITCNKPLHKLTSSDIQLMIDDMISHNRKVGTIKHMLTLVRQSLLKARTLGLINNLSCMDGLELPKTNKKAVKSLDKLFVDKIYTNAHKSIYGDFFLVLLLSGMRVGELIALRWCDVDFFSNCIHISNTDYNGQLQPCKTDSGIRTIPMYGRLEQIIKDRYKITGNQKYSRIFLNTLGRPIKYRTLLDNWHWFIQSIGIHDIVGLHTLRHTFTHLSLRKGIPVKVVSAWLGHSDISLTLRIYDNLDKDDFVCAAKQLDELFG